MTCFAGPVGPALAGGAASATRSIQLAELTNVTPSSMTHRIDKMAARGLVKRSPDRTNRTRVHLSLTAQGWDLFSSAIREADVVESDTLRRLSEDEREELARLLEIVIAGLDDIEA